MGNSSNSTISVAPAVYSSVLAGRSQWTSPARTWRAV
jgi:hypothetical protein